MILDPLKKAAITIAIPPLCQPVKFSTEIFVTCFHSLVTILQCKNTVRLTYIHLKSSKLLTVNLYAGKMIKNKKPSYILPTNNAAE